MCGVGHEWGPWIGNVCILSAFGVLGFGVSVWAFLRSVQLLCSDCELWINFVCIWKVWLLGMWKVFKPFHVYYFVNKIRFVEQNSLLKCQTSIGPEMTCPRALFPHISTSHPECKDRTETAFREMGPVSIILQRIYCLRRDSSPCKFLRAGSKVNYPSPLTARSFLWARLVFTHHAACRDTKFSTLYHPPHLFYPSDHYPCSLELPRRLGSGDESDGKRISHLQYQTYRRHLKNRLNVTVFRKLPFDPFPTAKRPNEF
jgi:hypothetical protein